MDQITHDVRSSQWLEIIERIGSQIPLDIHYRHDNHFYAYQSGSDRQRKG